jgi:hypothetical protein
MSPLSRLSSLERMQFISLATMFVRLITSSLSGHPIGVPSSAIESNVPYNDASDSEEEDAYALDEVSSDVMMDPDELDDDEDLAYEPCLLKCSANLD